MATAPLTATRKHIVAAIIDLGGVATSDDIHAQLARAYMPPRYSLSLARVRNVLSAMVKDGYVHKEMLLDRARGGQRGLYTLALGVTPESDLSPVPIVRRSTRRDPEAGWQEAMAGMRYDNAAEGFDGWWRGRPAVEEQSFCGCTAALAAGVR